jgi:hypothetical protein
VPQADVSSCSKTREDSFDHFVGAGEQRGRNFKAERSGGRQVDDQFKLGRLHYRQVGRLSTLEDLAGVDADLTVRFRLARSVAHEAASFRILAYIIVMNSRRFTRSPRRRARAALQAP